MDKSKIDEMNEQELDELIVQMKKREEEIAEELKRIEAVESVETTVGVWCSII